MYISYRNCPKCGSETANKSQKSQAKADYLSAKSAEAGKLCRSCIATNVNDRRWADLDNIKKQSQRFLITNPSKGKPAWNRGIPRDEKTKAAISNTISKLGGRFGNKNPNFGKFKNHNTSEDYKLFKNRVHTLTERVKHLIPNYNDSLRGRCGIEGKFQIDHIKPITDCWYENWTPEQAADLSNLRFISWEENLKLRKWEKRNKYE